MCAGSKCAWEACERQARPGNTGEGEAHAKTCETCAIHSEALSAAARSAALMRLRALAMFISLIRMDRTAMRTVNHYSFLGTLQAAIE